MNLVDLFIVVVIVLAAAHGLTQGAALQVLSFGGFWVGLLVGAALAPVFSGFVSSSFGTAFVSLLTFLGFALVGGAIGRYAGTHAWGALQRRKLGAADAAVGAVVAVVAALAAVWLVAIILSAGPTQNVAHAVNNSAIVRALTDRLPPAPTVITRLQTFINTTPFPQFFELEPRIGEPVGLPDDPVVRAAVGAAGASTVRISGVGCGGIQTGSGFVAAPDIVVTNAHVVAGIDTVQVEDTNGGRHRATAVLFDPNLDIAVLRTTGLSGPALPMLRGRVERGQGGAILGFPGGGRFSAGAAAVLREFQAIGRDIYGRSVTRRNVYQLQASVRQGNSGGPFVREDGVVLGMVFAASTSDPNVGYALTSLEVAPRVDEAAARTGAADTGPCAA